MHPCWFSCCSRTPFDGYIRTLLLLSGCFPKESLMTSEIGCIFSMDAACVHVHYEYISLSSVGSQHSFHSSSMKRQWVTAIQYYPNTMNTKSSNHLTRREERQWFIWWRLCVHDVPISLQTAECGLQCLGPGSSRDVIAVGTIHASFRPITLITTRSARAGGGELINEVVRNAATCVMECIFGFYIQIYFV